MPEFLKRQKPLKELNHSFFEREVVEVISEWMWVLIIITFLALVVTFL